MLQWFTRFCEFAEFTEYLFHLEKPQLSESQFSRSYHFIEHSWAKWNLNNINLMGIVWGFAKKILNYYSIPLLSPILEIWSVMHQAPGVTFSDTRLSSNFVCPGDCLKSFSHSVCPPGMSEIRKKPVDLSYPPPLSIFVLDYQYRSGTANSNTVNSKFHLIQSLDHFFARFLSFHV